MRYLPFILFVLFAGAAPTCPEVVVTTAPCEGCAHIAWTPVGDAARTVVLRGYAPSDGQLAVVADISTEGQDALAVDDVSGRAIWGVASYYLDDYDVNNILIRRSGPYPIVGRVFLPVIRHAAE